MRTFRRGLFVLLSLAIPCQALALELGQSVGKIGLTTLAGERFDMSNYDERPATAVLFLSSRCETTHKSIAEISRLYNKYRYRDVLIVGVSSNATETDNELRQFAQHAGLIFPLYHDRDGSVARQFAAQRTPEIFLLDKQGQLVFHGGLQDARNRSHTRGVHLAGKQNEYRSASRKSNRSPIMFARHVIPATVEPLPIVRSPVDLPVLRGPAPRSARPRPASVRHRADVPPRCASVESIRAARGREQAAVHRATRRHVHNGSQCCARRAR